MKKKLLPALLALVMVLGLFPLAAFAAEEGSLSGADGVTVTEVGAFANAEHFKSYVNDTYYLNEGAGVQDVAANTVFVRLAKAVPDNHNLYILVRNSEDSAGVGSWYIPSPKSFAYFTDDKLTSGTSYTIRLGIYQADTLNSADDVYWEHEDGTWQKGRDNVVTHQVTVSASEKTAAPGSITLTETGADEAKGTIEWTNATSAESKITAKIGAPVSFTVTAPEGFAVKSVTIGGETATASDGKYSFVMDGKTEAVAVTYEADEEPAVEVDAEAVVTPTVKTAEDGTVSASATLSQETLESAIEAAKGDNESAVLASVSINASTEEDTPADVTTLTLPKTVVAALKNGDDEAIGVTIQTDVGEVALNNKAIEKIQSSYTSGEEATTIVVTKKDEADVTPPAGFDSEASGLIGYEITVTANGSEISGSAGWGTDVSITLTFEAPQDVDAQTDLTVYVGDEEKGSAVLSGRNIVVTVPHLTPVTVVYTNEAEAPAGVDIEYTRFTTPEDHLAGGYFTIKNVDEGTKVTAGSYLVQIVHDGVASLFVVSTDNDQLKFLCNCVQGDGLGVWKLDDASFDTIKDANVTSLSGENCLVFQNLNNPGFFVTES